MTSAVRPAVSGTALLQVSNLRTWFRSPAGTVRAVDGVSFRVRAGETYALVGESGSGKSVTALTLMGLVPAPAGRVEGGSVLLRGRELLGLPEEEWRRVRGRDVAMIFQEPMTSFNPVMTVGAQVMEPLSVHERSGPGEARLRALALLAKVRFADPERAFASFPHQLSGGMRQRAMIAMALACGPSLLVADEPTTALDTTIQAEILDLLERLKRELKLAVLLITHNLGIVSQTAARVGVMQAGRIVEEGPARRVLREPRHPYTRRLLGALPSAAKRARESPGGLRGRSAGAAEPLLTARDVAVHFPVTSGFLRRVTGCVKAVDGASLAVARGAVTALVGESGCGKTTLGKALLGLVPVTSGSATLGAADVVAARGPDLLALRRRMQIVFQDPYGSLNPRLTAGEIVTEGLVIHGLVGGREGRARAAAGLLDQVGLEPAAASRYPHEFSGGQRQRLGIARALATRPELLILDEATSALDVSIQAQILGLLAGLRRKLGLSYLLITHDLALVGYFADEVYVMQQGRIVEQGPVARVLGRPRHPHTRALMAAVPRVRGRP